MTLADIISFDNPLPVGTEFNAIEPISGLTVHYMVVAHQPFYEHGFVRPQLVVWPLSFHQREVEYAH